MAFIGALAAGVPVGDENSEDTSAIRNKDRNNKNPELSFL
jgi:hypothetical protein